MGVGVFILKVGCVSKTKCFMRLIVPVCVAWSAQISSVWGAVNFVTLDFKPFIWCEKDRAKGIYADLIEEIFFRLERSYSIECYPWKRSIYDVKQGRADGLFAAFRTTEREAFAYYVPTPIRKAQYVVFVSQERNLNFESVESLYGLTVGIAAGHSVSSAFDKAVADGKIITKESREIDLSLRMLQAGRIDAYVNDKTVGLLAVNKLGLQGKVVALENAISEVSPAHIIISKQSSTQNKERLVEEIDKALNNMWLDGTVENIYSNYTQAKQ